MESDTYLCTDCLTAATNIEAWLLDDLLGLSLESHSHLCGWLSGNPATVCNPLSVSRSIQRVGTVALVLKMSPQACVAALTCLAVTHLLISCIFVARRKRMAFPHGNLMGLMSFNFLMLTNVSCRATAGSNCTSKCYRLPAHFAILCRTVSQHDLTLARDTPDRDRSSTDIHAYESVRRGRRFLNNAVPPSDFRSQRRFFVPPIVVDLQGDAG